jgi:hypothetical protein
VPEPVIRRTILSSSPGRIGAVKRRAQNSAFGDVPSTSAAAGTPSPVQTGDCGWHEDPRELADVAEEWTASGDVSGDDEHAASRKAAATVSQMPGGRHTLELHRDSVLGSSRRLGWVRHLPQRRAAPPVVIRVGWPTVVAVAGATPAGQPPGNRGRPPIVESAGGDNVLRRRLLRLFLAIAVGLLLVVLTASPVFAAAPRVILVTGVNLARPVVLSDWYENGAIMGTAQDRELDPSAEDLANRLSYRIGMFWGEGRDLYIQSGKDPAALRLEEADQFGRFYPPTATHGAVFAFDRIPGPGALIRRLEPEGVAIFLRHGIGAGAPANLPIPSAGAPVSTPMDVGMGLALLGVVVLMMSPRTRSGAFPNERSGRSPRPPPCPLSLTANEQPVASMSSP